jgi:hypothetical protein
MYSFEVRFEVVSWSLMMLQTLLSLLYILIGQDKLNARLGQLLKEAFTHPVSKCILKSCLIGALVSDDASYSTLHSYAF